MATLKSKLTHVIPIFCVVNQHKFMRDFLFFFKYISDGSTKYLWSWKENQTKYVDIVCIF